MITIEVDPYYHESLSFAFCKGHRSGEVRLTVRSCPYPTAHSPLWSLYMNITLCVTPKTEVVNSCLE